MTIYWGAKEGKKKIPITSGAIPTSNRSQKVSLYIKYPSPTKILIKEIIILIMLPVSEEL